MNIQKLLLIGTLTLISVASLSAQTALPNPHDDSCWSSLSALRACQIQAYDQEQAYAQNCTSYPEYQCFDYYQPRQKAHNPEAKSAPKADTNSINASNGSSSTSPTEPYAPVLTGNKN